MLIRVLRMVLVPLLVITFAIGVVGQSAPMPFFGTWKINPAKSDMTATKLQFVPKPSGEITMTMQGTSYDFRIDGKPYASPFSSTATWTKTGPRSWKTLYRMNNVDNNTDTYTLSADGRSLTMETEILVPTRSQQTMTFARVGSGEGLIGTWQTKTFQTSDLSMSFTAGERGQVWLRILPVDANAVVPTDGTEGAVTGPATSIPAGMTVALKVTGARTFDMTLKHNGTLVFVDHGTVSTDGRTLTLDTINGPAGPTQDRTKLVYDKQP